MELRIKFEENYISAFDIVKKRLVVYYPNNTAVYMEFDNEEINISSLLGMLELFKYKIIENGTS